jgi:hypothetical protein
MNSRRSNAPAESPARGVLVAISTAGGLLHANGGFEEAGVGRELVGMEAEDSDAAPEHASKAVDSNARRVAGLRPWRLSREKQWANPEEDQP